MPSEHHIRLAFIMSGRPLHVRTTEAQSHRAPHSPGGAKRRGERSAFTRGLLDHAELLLRVFV